MFNQIDSSSKVNSREKIKNGNSFSSKEVTSSTRVEDIFAISETTKEINPPNLPKPDIFKPKKQENGQFSQDKDIIDNVHYLQAEKNKKLFLLLFVLVVIVLLFLLGFWAFRHFLTKPPSLEVNGDIKQVEKENINQEVDKKQDLFLDKKEEEIFEQEEDISKDTDQDGLSDSEENSIGTDINKEDTDDDMLFDREEIYVYKTDPLNPDTDGDGFLDGEEVLKGYNPLGSGRLYELNKK